MKNKIEDLRNHLFATLEALSDKENPMDLERARVISDVSQVIINTAKVEVDHIRAIGSNQGTGFIALPDTAPEGNGVRMVKGTAQSGSH